MPRSYAQKVGDFEDGQAVEDGGDGRALRDVAGIEQDAIGTVGALAADHGGEVGEAALIVLQRHETRMEVVRVENGEGADLRGQRRAGE